ncbi:hypothetical protein SAMN02910298_02040 [Pseudobutyrivibrio sp. YE44]|uniref:DUF6033 family protein n=1 Tax=Pseudobutyrivibrio sp. YE44 TaxID=1520802 RepID=UPI000890AE56|nr:DUF6033 family protein [Pseudobutyrivibrio sp. YE44]SDB41270.1 hypothetical protein SAMN02910298_02040 [Pseudobutyrivibrio sp. YE44]
MVGINGISNLYNQYDSSRLNKNKKTENASTSEVKKSEAAKPENSEGKLSTKGKDFLNSLREKYKDYDFIVADSDNDKKALADASDKEIAVLLSSSELERMAEDDDYAKEKLSQMETAIDMAKKINEQLAEDPEFAEDAGINKITIELGDDGSMKLFAELEKSSAKQRERIEANRQKNREAEKAEAKEAEEKRIEDRRTNPYEKAAEEYRQRTTVEASSFEELIAKIKGVDWESIPFDEIKAGDRIDFAV